MGPSLSEYVNLTKRLGGRRAFCDETWAVNALGDVLVADRFFHMDDVLVQQARAEAAPSSNIAAMMRWMRSHPGPIITSRVRPGFPGLVEFPLEAVVNHLGFAYFNSTAAYAVAYAIHIGVKQLSLFGFDFTYPNAHHAEKGRACVEFWIGMAVARGIDVRVPHCSSLLDACAPGERLYGYDCVDVQMTKAGKRTRVRFTEKAPPSAEEVERRYDHTVHPNRLVARE